MNSSREHHLMEQAVEKLLSLPNRLESELQAGHHHHRHRGREQIRHAFHAHAPLKDLQRLQKVKEDEQNWCLKLTPVFLGIAAICKENGHLDVGFSCHDGTYSIDFAVKTITEGDRSRYPSPSPGAQSPLSGLDNTPSKEKSPAYDLQDIAGVLEAYVVKQIKTYQEEHFYKFLGLGMTKMVAIMSPLLPAKLWAELDVVPMIFELGLEKPLGTQSARFTVDEEADSMARKCLMYYGPTSQPRLQVGYRNEVEVDASGHAQIANLASYQGTVSKNTWLAAMKYAETLKQRQVKIAFFNSTPQGGGVALMRHALIRFLRIVGVNCKWYVPKPKPEVFRITKTNHNILQGVADPEERLSQVQKDVMAEWVQHNAERFWVSPGGPLQPRSSGGADVIIVDDPQMPDLVQIAKHLDPSRPVIFRSHIQIRSDLADQSGTPTSEVWQWLWSKVRVADLFISHPVREFVPQAIDFAKVGYMPATTDWLDGLNKPIDDFNTQFYLHELNAEADRQGIPKIAFPTRRYIAQIARFDPSKGIPDVLAAYALLRRKHMKGAPRLETPQLIIAGHGAVDDPDASLIYDEIMAALDAEYADLRDDVVVLRLGPTDQLLNVLLARAHVALQLSTREGFEVKVSEALHKGVPVIATRAGGIPLQVVDGKSGFLVSPRDVVEVAEKLALLFSDRERYDEMSKWARLHVSDEVSTVGNALAWMYLADELSKGEKLRPNCAWVNDLAREKVGVPYERGETRLPRDESLDLNRSLNSGV